MWVGDTVIVRRSRRRDPRRWSACWPTGAPIPHRSRCPAAARSAAAAAVREEGEADTAAPAALFCSAQRKQAILHFAQRRAVEIEGPGDKLVDQLVDGGVIRTLPDLYRLGLTALASLERMADKSAQTCSMLESRARRRCRVSCWAGHPPCRRGHGQGPGPAFSAAWTRSWTPGRAAARGQRRRPGGGAEHPHVFRPAAQPRGGRAAVRLGPLARRANPGQGPRRWRQDLVITGTCPPWARGMPGPDWSRGCGRWQARSARRRITSWPAPRPAASSREKAGSCPAWRCRARSRTEGDARWPCVKILKMGDPRLLRVAQPGHGL